MRKVLKWIGIILGVFLGLILIAVAAAFLIAEEKLNRIYEVDPVAMEIPAQANPDRRDWPLMVVDFCADCHGGFFLSGDLINDDPLFGTLAAPNLTSGKGGIGGDYTDEDWIRALRHGIGQEGKPLVAMPSQATNKINDRDLAELIVYMKNLDPINNELPTMQIGPLLRLFIVAGLIPDLLPAESIDHEAVRPPDLVPAETAEYGEYLTFVCEVCHTEDLSGGSGAGEGMNLTPGGQLANWTEDDFIQTLRTGIAPDGKRLNGEEMPWLTFSRFSDQEMKAIWLYLSSIPAVETEHR